MSGRLVDLVAVQAKLDRLAELAATGALSRAADRGDELAAGVLDELDELATDNKEESLATVPVSIRLHPDTLAVAEALVDALAATPEARAAGAHWSRSMVVRLAVELGLRELEARAKKAAT